MKNNLFVNIIGDRFLQALQLSPLSTDSFSTLSKIQSAFKFNIPLSRDNGETEILEAWRIIYCDATGPTKGGVRFCPEINEENLSNIAFRIFLKAAANRLPHGGACGGVKVNPHSLSPTEKEYVSRAYVNALGEQIGQDRDILSPDLGTNAQVMSWMADQFNKRKGGNFPAAVNGKLLGKGGIEGREDATGIGAVHVLETILSDEKKSLENMSFSIQGAGSAGGKLALFLYQRGSKVIAMCDSSGGWHQDSGLNVPAIMEKKENGLSFNKMELEDATKVPRDKILEITSDCVVPAAIAEQINSGNVDKINCKYILEIANSPIESGQDEVLEEKGIIIIPDIVANAGGIIVSHFEWAQNLQGLRWKKANVLNLLKEKTTDAANQLLLISKKKKVSLPIASQLMALDNIKASLL